jgi:putative FmdB family regulatory protein
MPIYEYICEQCHMREELLQKFNEPSPHECPTCHAAGSLKKIVTRSSFHLKGGGWYKDLYSSSKPESKVSPTQATTDDASKKETTAA